MGTNLKYFDFRLRKIFMFYLEKKLILKFSSVAKSIQIRLSRNGKIFIF